VLCVTLKLGLSS